MWHSRPRREFSHPPNMTRHVAVRYSAPTCTKGAPMRFIFLLVPAIVLATACAAPAPPPQQQPTSDKPVAGGVFNWWVSTDALNWDPADNGRTRPGDNGLSQAYNGLLGFKRDTSVDYSSMNIVPELA